MLEALRAVRESDLVPSARHLIQTLISLGDPETCLIPDRFTPSLSDLKRFTGMSRSTVAVQLNYLEKEGWLKRDKPDTHRSWRDKERTRYFVQIPTSPLTGLASPAIGPPSPVTGPELVRSPDCTSPVTGHELPGLSSQANQRTTTGDVSPDVGPQDALFDSPSPTPPPPVAETQNTVSAAKKPPKLDHSTDPDFAEFWNTVPLKNGKPSAYKAWKAALKKPGVTNALLVEKMAEYRDYVKATGQQKIKYPQGWLTDERWNDELRIPQPDNDRQRHQRPASNAPTSIPTDEQCPEHRGQRRATCGLCRARRLARGDDQ